jgi:hypothetical protein
MVLRERTPGHLLFTVLTQWDWYYEELPTVDEDRFWRVVASILNPKEALVLELRFGRRLGYRLTFNAVASVLKRERDGRIGLSRTRAQQIEFKALRKLRHPASRALWMEAASADTREKLLREGKHERW